uniref:Uncharacterized protein n=1 Tax=Pithovirus LCDPAC02 TaxID=2506601 RepID=A0A481YPS9_9VIRU|nr:MAG: hypothetical protein LCDPAC02_02090 [Pithovirus LCDPAC02]
MLQQLLTIYDELIDVIRGDIDENSKIYARYMCSKIININARIRKKSLFVKFKLHYYDVDDGNCYYWIFLSNEEITFHSKISDEKYYKKYYSKIKYELNDYLHQLIKYLINDKQVDKSKWINIFAFDFDDIIKYELSNIDNIVCYFLEDNINISNIENILGYNFY